MNGSNIAIHFILISKWVGTCSLRFIKYEAVYKKRKLLQPILYKYKVEAIDFISYS